MHSFSPKLLDDLSIPVATGWLMGVCMEGRGKQELWFHTRPEILEALRELAIVRCSRI